ncbi:MAG: helix-turn-helix domain-containing protein [Bacilli bacterium]|jgi:DNA-binding transcriptional regulator YiaG|nr:helix-turn-helix domain-containing protein [Bacilli bacterium]
MDYARLIKELRSKMLLSQMEFAEYLGVSFSAVNRWEKGRYEPTIKTKRKLKELFIKYGLVDRD